MAFIPRIEREMEVKGSKVKKEKEVKEKEVKEDEVVEEEKVWSVQEVATQTQPVIYNSKEKKTYDLLSALVEMLNRTEE